MEPMDNLFAATHTITHEGRETRVQCEPGTNGGGLVCYTLEEWNAEVAADWVYYPEAGELFFQGQPPYGEWEIEEDDEDGYDPGDGFVWLPGGGSIVM